MVAFRVGADDAEVLGRELEPEFAARDLVDLPRGQVVVRLMVEGVVTKGFSGETARPHDGDH